METGFNMQAVTNPLETQARTRAQRWNGFLPGILLTGAIALLANEVSKSPWMQAHGISALTLAIVIGMITGNTFYPRIAGVSARGVAFSKQTLLRAGSTLYVLGLTF